MESLLEGIEVGLKLKFETEGRCSEEGGRRMNLNGDSDPTQIDATESLIQSRTQTLTPSGRNSSEGRTSSVFPLSSSLLVEIQGLNLLPEFSTIEDIKQLRAVLAGVETASNLDELR